MDRGNKVGREASFSSYISSDGENHVVNLSGSIQTLPSALVSSQDPSPITSGRIRADKAEITIFGAEKYFDVDVDEGDPSSFVDNYASKLGIKKQNHVDIMKKPSSMLVTPRSLVSEGSWTSQAALLSSSKQKGSGRSFFTGLSCHNSCADKKSVIINQRDEHDGVLGKESRMIQVDRRRQYETQIKANEFRKARSEKMSVVSGRDEYFAHSIQKHKLLTSSVSSIQLKEENIKVEEERKSIDVFGSHMMIKKGDIAKYLERKLSMLTWDAIPRSSTKSLPTSTRSGVDQDMESDASSDLFEIENLSSSDQFPFTSDGNSTCITPNYEPSEASISWSVVTATAEDASVMSDYDDRKQLSQNANNTVKPAATKERQRSRQGSILGCKSYKSVRVAETDGYRTCGKPKPGTQQHHPKLGSSMKNIGLP